MVEATSRKSNSVGSISKLGGWIRENSAFLRMRLKSRPKHLDYILKDIENYDKISNKYLKKPLASCEVLEIGYGARPNRLLAMQSLGFAATGIDFDRPMLEFSVRQILEIYRSNGFRRSAKTAVRALFFDKNERRALARSLATRGCRMKIDQEKFLVGNAASYDFGARRFDFIYSECVFEHIPPNDLEKLLVRMRNLLKPEGIAVIVPHIFTGIAGGHLVEWYPHAIMDKGKRTAPWEHLRAKREHADCYLNEIDFDGYSALFSKHFHLAEVRHKNFGLGRELLTADVIDELSNKHTEQDLLTNNVEFILRNN